MATQTLRVPADYAPSAMTYRLPLTRYLLKTLNSWSPVLPRKVIAEAMINADGYFFFCNLNEGLRAVQHQFTFYGKTGIDFSFLAGYETVVQSIVMLVSCQVDVPVLLANTHTPDPLGIAYAETGEATTYLDNQTDVYSPSFTTFNNNYVDERVQTTINANVPNVLFTGVPASGIAVAAPYSYKFTDVNPLGNIYTGINPNANFEGFARKGMLKFDPLSPSQLFYVAITSSSRSAIVQSFVPVITQWFWDSEVYYNITGIKVEYLITYDDALGIIDPGGGGTGGTGDNPQDGLKTKSGVYNLQAVTGGYHRVSQPGSIWHSRSSCGVPAKGFMKGGPIAGTGIADHDPKCTVTPDQRVFVVFARYRERTDPAQPLLTDTYEVYSDDDGITWSEPKVAFKDCKNPCIAQQDGNILRAAFFPDKDPDTGKPLNKGRIKATYQSASDEKPSGEFFFRASDGNELYISDNGFNITHGGRTDNRWILIIANSAADVQQFFSADDGQTWTQAAEQ